MKFLHISDLHIGRRLNGISLMEDQKAVLTEIVGMAEACDAVLIAGDLYDKAQPTAEAVRVTGDFLVSLHRLGKPVFVVSGNHDSAEQVAYCRELLGACGVFASPAYEGALACHTLTDGYGPVQVWLLPFLRPGSVRPYFPEVHTCEDAVRLALAGAKRDPAARHVLVAHQFVTGAQVCESETRMLGGLDQVGADVFEGFDYVALGHLHSPQALAGGRVRYAGSPLKYSLSEEHQRKSATVVELGAKGEFRCEQLPFHPTRDVRTVRGPLAEVCAPERYSTDYVYAALTDEAPLIDPVGALRLTYPNLIGMRMENSRTTEEAAAIAAGEDAERLTPMEHFMAFYRAQKGQQELDERRAAIMKQVIEEAEARLHETDPA